MKPDSYIPFYGDSFLRAMEGHSDAVGMAYFRAIWHYWSHEHCRGLADDNETLRRICRADKEDWQVIKDVVFDNHHCFTLGEDGLWHQKRAAVEWVKSLAKYQAAVINGRKGGRPAKPGNCQFPPKRQNVKP